MTDQTTPSPQPASAGGETPAEIVRRWANWIIDESSDMESDDHSAGKRKVRAERDTILSALSAPAPQAQPDAPTDAEERS